MNKFLAAAGIAGLTILGGCSTGRVAQPVPGVAAYPGAELFGQRLQVQSGGRTSVMTLNRDGTVTASFNGQQAQGNWAVAGGKICFIWGTVRDCWPYPQPFRKGETRTVTSDRGNVVVVTLL